MATESRSLGDPTASAAPSLDSGGHAMVEFAGAGARCLPTSGPVPTGTHGKEEMHVVGAIILGLVAGVVARLLMPNDVFRHMSGPSSWLTSIVLGLIGAVVGWFIFTYLLGIGDEDIFDLGGIVSAIIGTLIVLPIAAWVLRRSGRARA